MPTSPPDFPPVVLCFAAGDATGGGGLQSDILTLGSMGCHPLGVMTAVSVRDTRAIEELVALDADAFMLQARVVLEDIPVQAFKLGMCGSVENVAAVAEILSDYPDVPLVLGFGISTPAHARAMNGLVDGFIVGSALVRAAQDGVGAARDLVASLRAALDGGD